MSFGQAVSICARKYADFTGRAARSEYWWWALFVAILIAIAAAFDAATRSVVWGTFVSLVLLLPTLSAGVRRLRDAGIAWPWVLVGLIPVVGWVWLVVLLTRPPVPRDSVLEP